MTGLETVSVQADRRGEWNVSLGDGNQNLRCESFEDARRLGYLWAARRHPCELIVRDAYHRVVRREVIDGSEQHEATVSAS